MIRKITHLSVAVLFALSAHAQGLQYKYCTLNQETVITSTGSRVNIRKAPNLKAPTLYAGCIPETDDCANMWSNKLDKSYEPSPVYLTDVDVFVATGSENDFWQINLRDETEELIGYVSKKYTKEAELTPLTLDMLDNSFMYFPVTKGQYSGFVLCYEENEIAGFNQILVGSIINGRLVFSHAVDGSMSLELDRNGFSCDKNDVGGFVLRYSKKNMREITSDGEMYDVFDVNTLTDTEIYNLLKLLGVDDEPNVYRVDVMYNGTISCALKTMPEKSNKFTFYSSSAQVYKSVDAGYGADKVVDRNPEFPGGLEGLMTYLSSNIKYPESAIKNNITGKVILSFVVKRDGTIDDILVVKSVHPDLDAEAIRVVNNMPKWNPAKVKGKTVNMKYCLPITFNI